MFKYTNILKKNNIAIALRVVFLLTFLCFVLPVFSQNLLIQNKGQLPSLVKYQKILSNGFLYYKENGFTTLLRNNVEYDSLWHHFHQHKALKKTFKVNFHRFDVNFENALLSDIEHKYADVTIYNFFKGNNPKNWATDVKAYHEIIYHNIYSNINLQVQNYGNDVKHNYVVKSNANAADIKLRYKFTNKLSLVNNQLVIATSVGNVIEKQPIAFQIINKDTIFITCAYQLKRDKSDYIVSFKLGEYNKNVELVIDPILVFATYSGSKGDNF